MTQILEQLIKLLNVRKLNNSSFSGLNADIGLPRVFGGQVLGQALVSAANTLEDKSFDLHSFHSYFLKLGDPSIPIIFEVDQIREGNSFCTRRVVAKQKDTSIFNLSCSFHRAESGIQHQLDRIELPAPPETLKSLTDHRDNLVESMPFLREIANFELPIDIRPIDFLGFFKPKVDQARAMTWMKPKGQLPNSPLIQQAILAFMSDISLLGTAGRPHGLSFLDPGVMAASLDHSMWFHRPFDLNDWLLYVTDAPIAHGARAFTRGALYNRSGELIASTAQEGIIRVGDHR